MLKRRGCADVPGHLARAGQLYAHQASEDGPDGALASQPLQDSGKTHSSNKNVMSAGCFECALEVPLLCGFMEG